MPQPEGAPWIPNGSAMARADAGGKRFRQLRARWASSDPVVAALELEIEALTEQVRVLALLARTDPLTGWRTAAAGMSSSLASVDILCRWGGDEFAVLLPACPRAQADEVIARLQAATPRQQSCAAGLVGWDGSETPEGLLGRADQALFDAKGVRRRSLNGSPADPTGAALP